MRLLFIATLATASVAVSTAQLQKKDENTVGTKLLAPCGPELVQNGSFEASHFPTVALTFLNDANNCKTKDDPCLDAWSVGGVVPDNKLAWAQSPTGISGVPDDPINSPTDKRFINLSGEKNGPNFPPVSQTIHQLEAGIYELRFKLGQGDAGPASADVTIRGAASGGSPPTFTTKSDEGAWQDFTVRFGSNGKDVILEFVAHAHPGSVKFIGLDNVSIKKLFEPGSRACLLGKKVLPTIR